MCILTCSVYISSPEAELGSEDNPTAHTFITHTHTHTHTPTHNHTTHTHTRTTPRTHSHAHTHTLFPQPFQIDWCRCDPDNLEVESIETPARLPYKFSSGSTKGKGGIDR